MAMDACMEERKAGEGQENFAAATQCHAFGVGGGTGGKRLAVVEISEPVVDGNDLLYK
jgi:hypothetical protein